jgi:hypothetical protein
LRVACAHSDSDSDAAPSSPRTTKTGQITVVCVPACGEVFDGRTPLGPSPIFRAPLIVGPHRLRLKVTDPPAEKSVDVTVTEDDVTVVRQSMK